MRAQRRFWVNAPLHDPYHGVQTAMIHQLGVRSHLERSMKELQPGAWTLVERAQE